VARRCLARLFEQLSGHVVQLRIGRRIERVVEERGDGDERDL